MEIKLSQLPLADRMTAAMVLYLENFEKLTERERQAFAGMFAWLPTVITVVKPPETTEPPSPVGAPILQSGAPV